MTSLGQENGGPNIRESFNMEVRSLRRCLSTIQAPNYATDTPEFALILRVDGSLKKYGPEGVEPPKLRRGYIQVDIVVSEKRWQASPAEQRRYLADVVGEAFVAIADKLEAKKRLLDRQRLLQDYEAVKKQYLASQSGAESSGSQE
jgi:hypothetical protein